MILLNFQFFEGDKDQAMELARLIADIEPSFRDDVEVLFSARYDCRHDLATIAYVSKKFKVHKFTSSSRDTGWPHGCNRLFADSYQHFVELERAGATKADCCLFIESDCVPLHKDWINILYNEFKGSGKLVSGAWLTVEDSGCDHVNGNCIIHKDLWKVDRRIFNPPAQGGWDATCFSFIRPNAYPSRYIFSDYRLGKPENPWKGCDYLFGPKRYGSPSNPLFGETLQPVWYHGPKTMDGIECARKKLINS